MADNNLKQEIIEQLASLLWHRETDLHGAKGDSDGSEEGDETYDGQGHQRGCGSHPTAH